MRLFPALRRLGPTAAACGALAGTLARRSVCDASQPGYKEPPAEVAALADYKPVPQASIQPRQQQHILYLHHKPMLDLEDVSAPVLKLGGKRFNPCTLVPHGSHGVDLYHTSLELQNVATRETKSVTGLPEGSRMQNFRWSPDGSRLAFTLRTTEAGHDAECRLWILDVDSATAQPVQPAQRLNGVLGGSFCWLPDSRSLIVKRPIGTHADAPAPAVVPSSPSVQQASGGGVKAAVRTYPDLLSSAEDAAMFEHYTTVQLVRLELGFRTPAVGAALPPPTVVSEELLGPPSINIGLAPSPDGRQLLTTAVRPECMSYAVPWARFGRRVAVLPLGPATVCGATPPDAPLPPPKLLHETAALEALPIGHDAVQTGPRGWSWRPDQPATLYYVEALDGGNPKAKPPGGHRDKLMLLPSPFAAPPVEWLRTQWRFQFARWAADGSALCWERWYHTRRTVITRIAPSDDFSDAYNHPGTPLLTPGPFGASVLRLIDGEGGRGSDVLWEGNGASPDGARPFVDQRDFATGAKRRRLWRGAVGCYDDPYAVLHPEAAQAVAPGASSAGAPLVLITRRQTQTQPPQMLLKVVTAAASAAADADGDADASTLLATLSDPPHPQPSLLGVQKSLIKYERADGVPLSGTLYTPAGYDATRDGALPTLLWAYPREYKSKKAAGQVRGSEHTFTTVHWGSPLFWLTRGYAVLDGFAMPIIGEGEQHENDQYVEQLQLNAQAAADELRRRGVADHRLAVGGHSYGAFMTANLLARAPGLFCAGIARNGAYNRSLTPFGFQAEERSFWEAQSTYAEMSPFFQADKITAPLLLIHGEKDPNPGTFPMQSERLFAAIKGLGGTARLVLLPNEGHFYRSRESILHVLAEQDDWLEAHVKAAPPPPSAAPSTATPSAPSKL